VDGGSSTDSGYSGAAITGAVLGALFFPFVSLLVALLLQGGQTHPRKKEQLRSWAWVSGAWLVIGAVFVAVLSSITF